MLQNRCFPVKYAKFLRTPILKNICKRLLLLVSSKTTWVILEGKRKKGKIVFKPKEKGFPIRYYLLQCFIKFSVFANKIWFSYSKKKAIFFSWKFWTFKTNFSEKYCSLFHPAAIYTGWSPPEVFLGKCVLKICSKFTGEPPPSHAEVRQSNFIEITLRHWFSALNLLHIFRIPFLKNTFGRLLLYIATGCNSAEAPFVISQNYKHTKTETTWTQTFENLVLSSQKGHMQYSRKLHNQRQRDGFFSFSKSLFFVFGQASSLNVFSTLFVKVLTIYSMWDLLFCVCNAKYITIYLSNGNGVRKRMY